MNKYFFFFFLPLPDQALAADECSYSFVFKTLSTILEFCTLKLPRLCLVSTVKVYLAAAATVMVNGNGMQGSDGLAGPREERYLQQCLRGLFCCFFRLPGDEQRMRTGGDFGPGEQTVQITVENLGMRNVGFSLLDEEPPRRSANPVRVCTPVLRKRRVKPPRSISQDVLLISSSGEDGDEEEEKEKEHGLLLKESAVADGLWAQPAFHLIPPTPSSVADEGQFFNVSPIKVGVSEGGSAHERKSCGEAEEAPAALTLAEDGEKERDPQLSAMSKDEGKKLKFSRRSQQGASLAEYPRKSESAPPMPFHQSCISVLFATRRLPTASESH